MRTPELMVGRLDELEGGDLVLVLRGSHEAVQGIQEEEDDEHGRQTERRGDRPRLDVRD